MHAKELAIDRVAGAGLQGGQVVRPAFQEQPFGGRPVALLLMEKRQVPAGARQLISQVQLVGEFSRQLPCLRPGPSILAMECLNA
jgi:hypothetical protein